MVEKILMLVGSYVGDYEVMVPFQVLQMVDHAAYAVCPDRHVDDSVTIVAHDFEGVRIYSEKPDHRFTANATFADVDPATYDTLVVPGGRVPECLCLNACVLEVVRHFFQADKPVAAICRGAQLLSATGVLEGKVCLTYPACSLEVTTAGGAFKGIPVGQAYADGKLVTAPAWPAHSAWLAQFLEVLGTRVPH